jgi:hypothetical protein
MKPRKLFQIIALLFLIPAFVMFQMSGCKKDDKQNEENENPTIVHPFPVVELSGTLEITPGASISASEITALSFSDSDQLSSTGTFLIKIPETLRNQVIFFTNADDNPIYLGIYNPLTKVLSANETSTALALTMFNPYMIFSDQTKRQEYLASVQSNSNFSSLVSGLTLAYQTDADMALDYEKNPGIYQLVAQITKETLENYGYFEQTEDLGNPPYIEDVAGSEINLVNSRHVWYAAGIYPDGNSLSDVTSVNKKETILSFEWGWPPVTQAEPAITPYDLGDGFFKIYMAKGFDFSKFGDFGDPMGRATTLNTAQSILYVIDIIVGFVPMPDLAKLPNHLHIPEDVVLSMYYNLAKGDVQAFLLDFFTLINDNGQEIAYWVYQENANAATAHFIKAASGILKNVGLVFKVLGLANEQGPFFFDLAFAPSEVTYFITQEGGEIISNTQNDGPLAEFTSDPPAGVIGTVFNFDASLTSDDNTPLNELQFRWDFEGNGNWTEWSNDPYASNVYSHTGSFNVALEAKDMDNLIGVVAHNLNIGGGAGTAEHIKLFMDVEPWGSDAMEQMLISLGFTSGTGYNTFEIIPSSQMGSVTLTPGEDLVIISNDQLQSFYNNYATNQTKFSNFVYMGGSMFWEACDEGWNYGSMAEAGIILPGNIDINLNFDNYNYVVNPTLPLVAGLPASMDHNYASHEYFTNYPDGTIVYCEDSGGGATLIEVSLGGGWFVLSGQPLEHQYENIFGNPDMEELLPRIVGYFTNKTPVMNKRTLKTSSKATHIK